MEEKKENIVCTICREYGPGKLMYAIRHKKTYEWVYGTDYRCHHKRKDGKRSYSQRTSHNKALIFEDLPNASLEFQLRGISSRYYEIVEVEIQVVGPLKFYANGVPYYTSLETERLFNKGELDGHK